MKTWTFESRSESQTAALGATLADCLPKRALVTLDGTLGAGKTRFVQGLAIAAGVDPRAVVSPTFTLIQEYTGRVPIYHFDAYRIGSDQEFLDLGFEEYLGVDGWCLIEWAERVERCLPDERLEIRIAVTSDESRTFVVSSRGADYESVIDCVRGRLGNLDDPKT